MNTSDGWRCTHPWRESARQFEANLRTALSVQHTGRPAALIGAGRYWVASLINHRMTVQLDAGRLMVSVSAPTRWAVVDDDGPLFEGDETSIRMIWRQMTVDGNPNNIRWTGALQLKPINAAGAVEARHA